MNEVATEAAAVTSVGIGRTSVDPGFVMRVDRPFVFVIRENYSQSILFMGKIVEPNLNKIRRNSLPRTTMEYHRKRLEIDSRYCAFV